MRRQAGFTFVELIVVLVIIGILAVIAIPRLTPKLAFDHSGFHQEVAASLRYGQKYAVAAGCPIRVVVGTNTIQLRHSVTCAGGDFSVFLRHPVRGGSYSVTAPSGVTLNPTGSFEFTGTGEANMDFAFNVVAGSATRPITVVSATGYVDSL